MLHLYDTRTRTAQDISPMDGKTLRFYCCGPTVYGPAHIGNFRTAVSWNWGEFPPRISAI